MPHIVEDTDEGLEADIAEFARHNRGGGWALALLVVRRVEPDAGNGLTFEQQAKRFDRNAFRQISAKEFARRSKTATKRVLALREAWIRAAEAGKVPALERVLAGEFVELPDAAEVPFYGEDGYYRGYEARMPKGERRDALQAEAERAGVRPSAPVYVAQHPSAVKAAVIADEVTRTAALEGIAELRRRDEETQDQAEGQAARDVAEQHARELDGRADSWSSQSDEKGMDPAAAAAAVRAAAEPGEADAALQVFNELAQVRLGTLRVLSLLQRHPVQFTGERGKTITELCEATKAAVDFIRDLAASPYQVLDDAALRAFLEESEKLG
ncbi:hypothetical protein [Streptomyces sp. 8L]|uniref:hypothetical protein n=1 Tax=Streptomyces sp. 8L TaxID=2877242 RepID=UPI001CD21AC2|nr:hypothetical protein [Streptomyces sp. 8L]MCA1221808.1 hypothetical protein [Streptomyces sp. 8L]